MFGYSSGNPPPPPPPSGFGFVEGQTVAANPAFGGAISNTAPFGTAATSTPVFGVAPAGYSTFGAVAAATPLFGATTAAPPAFVATAPPPGFGALTATAPTFGSGIAAGTSAFGAPQAIAAPSFGAAPAFGAITSTAPTFGSGTTAGTSAFGAPQATAAPAFSAAPAFCNVAAPAYGLTTTSAAAPFTFNFGGATATTPTVFNVPPFGAIGTTATSLAPTSTVPTLGLGLGSGIMAFNKPATTSASINFGTITSTVTPYLGGAPGTNWRPVPVTTMTTMNTPLVGLGGIDVGAIQPKVWSLNHESVKVKECQVPDEIARTVDALKNHIKSEKTLCSDIARTSTSEYTDVSNGITNLEWALKEISSSVDANYKQVKLLRQGSSKAMELVEMAQRTQDTPPGLQFQNTAPFQFFQSLVSKYEQDLINFQQQIAITEHHMRSLGNPQAVSPDDLKLAFRQINESFISLAGRLHDLHQNVEVAKEQFLNLRKYRLRDTTNVFAELENPTVMVDSMPTATGPTPFSNISCLDRT